MNDTQKLPPSMEFVTPRDAIKAKFAGKQHPAPEKDQLGRIPPQATEMEEAVLGALMLESKALDRVIGFLRSGMFYREAHSLIYDAVQCLEAAGSPVDLITLKNQLQANNTLEKVGGVIYLTELSSKVAGASNIEYHARVIAQKWLSRELIKVSDDAISRAYSNDDPFDLMDDLETQVRHLLDFAGNSNAVPVAEYAEPFGQRLREKAAEMRTNPERTFTGISYGLPILDSVTDGAHPGQLIVLAARPAMGKTHTAIHFMQTWANTGVPAAFFSYEMPLDELTQRIVANEMEINSFEIRKASMDDEKIEQIIQRLKAAKYRNQYIDDCTGLTITGLCRKIKALVKTSRIKVAVIDYLGLIQKDRASSRYREENETKAVGEMCRVLKALAKELGIPIFLYCQLSRKVEERPLKLPQLADLRDSGEIEQHADMVVFLYRPAYYESDNHIKKKFEGLKHSEFQKLILMNIAKQRGGITCWVPAFIDLKYAKLYHVDYQGFYTRLGGGYTEYIKPENMQKLGISTHMDGHDDMGLFAPQPVVPMQQDPLLKAAKQVTPIHEQDDDFPF